MKKYKVGVVGATGAVGREMIRVLEELNFPVEDLRLFASERSRGKKLLFKDKEIEVEVLEEKILDEFDREIILMSAGASISKEWAKRFTQKRCFVIDNSSAWRMDKDVPLVVPEVNPHTLSKDKKLIANPNCSTIQMVQVLAPIYRVNRIKRIIVSTYQAVSGAGWKAVEELKSQLKEIVESDFEKKILPRTRIKVFPHQIALNVIPQIDIFLENSYTKEEMKMVNETRKILEDNDIKISATCVRVPVLRGHSEAVTVELENKMSADEIREILSKVENVILIDDLSNLKYPLPIEADGKFETFVGRIREDLAFENGINMWIVSDNLLKGAALNAVQIAFKLIEKNIV
ncbi:MAG: aspartate-semialdehyde dehydrogenase [Caldiserica bacterium]|nr:MAG: aspartate-semialdehyde dehydrogenase [Caldisericota bacterium]